jgi:hypothetical protein
LATCDLSTLFFIRQFMKSFHMIVVSFKLNFRALKNRSR